MSNQFNQWQQGQNQGYNQYQQYQPVFHQYAVGSGIDNSEYNAIKNSCIQAFQARINPYSTNAANHIKKAIGGEWFVCCSGVGCKNFDFCLSSVTGGDFMSFSLDNVLFEVCRLK